MEHNHELEKLWLELESIKYIEDRVVLIHADINSKKARYRRLAEEQPYRLFELLEGDEAEIATRNWAFEYTYENYISDNDIEYNSEEAKQWDLQEKSIEQAHDSGYWYVTGYSVIKGPNDIELGFEFEFCEGYIDKIIGTPYNENEHGNHGIEFD